MTRILVSAAEPSADRYIARLVPALTRQLPGCTIDAIGGPHTARTGATILHPMADLQAFGLAEAARGLGTHLRLYRDLRAAFRRGAWDLVVLCDYPGWHLRVGRAARAAGVPVLYYVAPQLWAWGAWRTERLRAAASRLAVIMPFEEAFFAQRRLPARFVGHPLLDEPRLGRAAVREALGLAPDQRVVAVLPGARPDDVRRHWPLFREAARQARRRLGDVTLLVGGLPDRQYGDTDGFRLVGGGPRALAAADAALIKSGTATLEAALLDVPAVVSYRLHPATWFVARRLVRVPSVSLANLVAEEPVQPEYLQRNATPGALADALVQLLLEPEAAARQRAGYRVVRERLGTAGAAERVAGMAGELAA